MNPLVGCLEDIQSDCGCVLERLMEDFGYSQIGANVC